MQSNNTMHYEAVYNVLMLTMTSELAQRQIFMGLGLIYIFVVMFCLILLSFVTH